MRQLPKITDPNLIVGADTADDAGVYRIGRDLALVQTVDFFTPVVDDPFLYGQIAAANSISDVYAMGGTPLTALNILGVPANTVSPDVIAAILRGGALKAKEAKCTVVGGHTIRNPEPIYGMAVTGLVSPRRMLTNAGARAGDWLVLTKPIGTGIITTGIKLGITPEKIARKAISVMTKLNLAGPALAKKGLAKAAVDVTGFGLLGHLELICRNSGVGAEVNWGKVPLIDAGVFRLIQEDCIPGGTRQNLEAANAFTDWGKADEAQKFLLTDAQTSGGLLLCVPPRHLEKVLKILKEFRTPCAAVIGRMVKSPKPIIRIMS